MAVPRLSKWYGAWATAHQMRLAKPKDSHQGVIDTPLLLRAHPAHELTKPSCVDGADLLNQDAGGLAKQLDLRAK